MMSTGKNRRIVDISGPSIRSFKIKEEKLKLFLDTAEANRFVQQMTNRMGALKQLTKSQESTLNEVVDQVNDLNSR